MTDHALLLVNLGSPASTSVADVRSYLNQFLMDPYVIDLPWPVRRLLVSLILIKRPEQSAHAYASIKSNTRSRAISPTCISALLISIARVLCRRASSAPKIAARVLLRAAMMNGNPKRSR